MTSISPEVYEDLKQKLHDFVTKELSKAYPKLKPGDNLTVNIDLTLSATDEATGEYINLLKRTIEIDEELLVAHKALAIVPKRIVIVLN